MHPVILDEKSTEFPEKSIFARIFFTLKQAQTIIFQEAGLWNSKFATTKIVQIAYLGKEIFELASYQIVWRSL